MKTKRFRKWCAIFIPTLVIIFFFAGFLFAPNDPMKSNLLERYADPSAEYPFGTDALGRCILSRILYGGWTTLGIVLGGSPTSVISLDRWVQIKIRQKRK